MPQAAHHRVVGSDSSGFMQDFWSAPPLSPPRRGGGLTPPLPRSCASLRYHFGPSLQDALDGGVAAVQPLLGRLRAGLLVRVLVVPDRVPRPVEQPPRPRPHLLGGPVVPRPGGVGVVGPRSQLVLHVLE